MANMIEFFLAGEKETIALGAELSRCLKGRGIIYLRGDLGAGKTTLCRGILRAMSYEGAVKSPTFTLVEPYNFPEGQVYHFDLYRLNDPDELEYIGIDDYFSDQSLCLIEWPEKALGTLPLGDIDLELFMAGRQRTVVLNAMSDYGKSVLERLRFGLDCDPG